MQLTALVDGPDHVCCRYRLAPFRSIFRQSGFELELRPFPARWWNRLAAFRIAGAAIVQRRLLSSAETRLLRWRCGTPIFDFDDAIWLRDSYSAKGLRSMRRLRRFAATIRAAEVVVAGNEFLAEQSRRFTRTEHVVVIPTCVDPTRYPIAAHVDAAKLRLVWIGSSSTLPGLRRFAATLEEIGRQIPAASLKVICDRFFTLPMLPVEHCTWSERTEAAEIAAADIGIAWMPDDDWSRGKCGLKLLQYMAAGLPVIANPVGVHCEMIRHGENGFLAHTAPEWCEAVRILGADPELRRKMGAAGRRRVECDYSIAAGGRLWGSVLNRIGLRQAAA